MTTTLIAYESLFGNGEAIARAVGEGLDSHGSVRIADVRDTPAKIDDTIDLLVVGGPTHQLGLTRPASRQQAAGTYPEAPAAAATGLREWLTSLRAPADLPVAVFDTRLRKPALLRKLDHAAGSAQRILRRRGLRVLCAPEHFLVETATGPLTAGEIDRARAWGKRLAMLMQAPSQTPSR